MRGYHHGDYGQPRTAEGRFEMIMGAILTQNSSWTNAEKAMFRLRRAGIRLPAQIRTCSPDRLAALVRPSGYYNQKARKLKAIASLYPTRDSLALRCRPSRETLLSQWGIGPETADSILLYAYHVPEFVVDAYTKRLLSRVGITAGEEGYGEIQEIFHEALPLRHETFNEYHALIVEHAKRHCRAKPLCKGCPVRVCRYRDSMRA
jgi:endonuclease-3 related protein